MSQISRVFDFGSRIPRPNPAFRLIPQDSNSGVNMGLTHPVGIVARQSNSFGSSNVALDGEHLFGLPHTAIALPRTIVRSTTSKRTQILPGELGFDKLYDHFLNGARVWVVTFRQNLEKAYPANLISMDPTTKTFCINNPHSDSLKPGDSNAVVIIDLDASRSIRIGLVNAMANSDSEVLRCFRDDSVVSVHSFPSDIEIFNFSWLPEDRLKGLERKIGTRDLRIPEGIPIETWEPKGKYNYDLRKSGLSPVDQLAYAGHLVFKTYEAVVTENGIRPKTPLCQSIGDMTDVKLAKSILGKTCVVDAYSDVHDVRNGSMLKLEINADCPAPGTEGPPVPHVGFKISSKKPLLRIVGHILVNEVDACRPAVK